MKTSDRTKLLLANSLKKLVIEKDIEQISVKDICKISGLNRNSFYYHFLDKQDLVSFIYKKEIIEPLSQVPNDRHWGAGTLLILKGMRENRIFYKRVLKMKGQNNFEESLFAETVLNFYSVIDKGLGENEIDAKSRSFIARFYAYSFTCMTVDWIREDMQESPDRFMQRLVDVTDGGIFYAAKKSAETEKKREHGF